MRKVQKGFTLVELIVVITILAILGTIAFISLQGYSQDAKNSKVTSDLRTLVSAIETKASTDGATISSFMTATNTNDVDTASTVAYKTNTGADAVGALSTFNYDSGEINFIALGQNGDDFTYDDGKKYVIATASTGATNYYQVAGQTKNSGGNYVAVVKGTYIQDTAQSASAEGLIDTVGSADTNGIENDDNLGTTGLYQ